MANNKALCTLCGGVAFLLIGYFAISFSPLSPNEVGLKYNFVQQYVENQSVQEPGLHFLGPFTKFIRYSKTVQILDLGSLKARCNDGIPLELSVVFQYVFKAEELYDLYREYDANYEDVFRNKAVQIVTTVATSYSPYDLFNSRQTVADKMRSEMDKFFSSNLHVTVPTLQIQGDSLPDSFSNTITQAQIEKNTILATKNFKAQQEVLFNTSVKIAEKQAKITVTLAGGDAAAILTQAHADAQVIIDYTSAETQWYGSIKQNMTLEGSSLLDYIWYDTLAGDSVGAEGMNTTVLVGVTPSAYISGNLNQ